MTQIRFDSLRQPYSQPARLAGVQLTHTCMRACMTDKAWHGQARPKNTTPHHSTTNLSFGTERLDARHCISGCSGGWGCGGVGKKEGGARDRPAGPDHPGRQAIDVDDAMHDARLHAWSSTVLYCIVLLPLAGWFKFLRVVSCLVKPKNTKKNKIPIQLLFSRTKRTNKKKRRAPSFRFSIFGLLMIGRGREGRGGGSVLYCTVLYCLGLGNSTRLADSPPSQLWVKSAGLS